MADDNQGLDLSNLLWGAWTGWSTDQKVSWWTWIKLQWQKLMWTAVAADQEKGDSSDSAIKTQPTKLSFSWNTSSAKTTNEPVITGDKTKSTSAKQDTTVEKNTTVSQDSAKPSQSSIFAGYAAQKAQKEADKRKQQETQTTPRRLSSLFGSTIFMIFGALSVFFFIQYQYHKEAAKPILDNRYDNVISWYRTLENTISTYIPINDFDIFNNINFIEGDSSQKVASVIDAKWLNYVHKRDLTNKAVHQIGNNIVALKTEIDEIKSDTAEFGLFDKELSTLLNVDKTESSIQESLLSLETIKFATALQVFALLDTFTNPLARTTKNTQEYVLDQMRLYIERWEVDISNYLQSCYLNPFESWDTCKNIDDFKKYFEFLEQRPDFDVELFKQMIVFAEQKLEDDQFPNLWIQFERFDPASQRLSFTVSVNTTIYDRKQLEQLWVVAPQIFVITNLVNLLKQSKFVLWESINVNKLNITKKDIKVWWNPEQIYSTELVFSLPLQKWTQREIFDYQFQEEFDLLTTNLNLQGIIDTNTTEITLEANWVSWAVIVTTWSTITPQLEIDTIVQ